ncbi:MAG TPA: hypothetical protein VM327_06890 [Candidatus Thermoplasmatota archaeon]|nr:hypothetical protein [Candidatus Thermoplasmatota archaeon]
MHTQHTILIVSLLALSAMALSGCSGTTTGPTAPLLPVADRVAPPVERSLAAAPVYEVGEWWQVRATFEPGIAVEEARIVMAGEREGQWLFGMPEDGFSEFIAQFHFPPIGPVEKGTLRYEVHMQEFDLLHFPLAEGTTWSTPFAGQTCSVTVLSASGSTARLEMGRLTDPCTWHAIVDYDAATGLPTKVVLDDYGSLEVLDHGFGHKGRVLVPDQHHMEIFEARIGGVLHPVGPEARAPTAVVQLPEGYTHVTLAILAGAFFVPPTPGEFSAKVTLPDGTVLGQEWTPLEGIGTSFQVQRLEAQVGPWSIELVAGGGGAAIVEGLAWKELVIDLP